MYDAHAVIAWAMDRPKKYRAEFKFDERSVSLDRYGETLTTSRLLETPPFPWKT
jgi:tRNA U55 pseudouridine synthase TruB